MSTPTRTLIAPVWSSEVREQLPADSYPARLVSFIYLGTQPWTPQYPKEKIKIRLTFEFPTEKRVFNEEQWEKPYIVSRDFTFSMFSQGKLLPFVEWMIGKKITEDEAKTFNILSLVWEPYLVTIIHNAKGYADIQSATKLPKMIECPPQITPTKIILQEDWEKEWDKLPRFIQEKIAKSAEYRGVPNHELSNAPLDSSDWDEAIKEVPWF